MDFLGIGLPELAVILILALIVVGPKRLPETAAQIARTIREVKRYSSSMTRELNTVVKDLEREYEEVKGEMKGVASELSETSQSISRELMGATEDAQKQLKDGVAVSTGPAKVDGPSHPPEQKPSPEPQEQKEP